MLNMLPTSTRCCIAGGGPAGIMLGYMLARAGIDVTVIEKHSDFLRDFRGDTIHPSTMENLHELGLLDAFLKLPHQKTKQVSLYFGKTKVTVADFTTLKSRAPYVAFIPQWDFLNFLSEEASKFPNFHLLMDTQVTGLTRQNGRVTGVEVELNGKKSTIMAELVIGADGRKSIVREKAHLQVQTFGAAIDVLWFRISRNKTDPSHLTSSIDNGHMIIMIDRGDYWQCGFLIVKGDFEAVKKQGVEAFRQTIGKLAPFAQQALTQLKDWDEVKLLSVSVDRLKQWYAPGVLCIGDAAHAMSPMGGVGINLAIQDAVAAANVLIPAFKEGVPTEKDLSKVQKRRTFPTSITQAFQVFMQDRILLPYLHSDVKVKPPLPFRLVKRFPFLRRFPARFIGICVQPEHIASL